MGKMEPATKDCFVIMPISESKEYQNGHFKRVYEDIFSPAIQKVGYTPRRADETKSSGLIQLDILKQLVQAPMAICDLSTRNPNVMFELGIRQAFDKPVVLVREIGTPDIFDITQIRYTEYRKEMLYHEVLEDQKKIEEAIAATQEQQTPNSIIRLLEIGEGAKLSGTSSENGNDVLGFLIDELSGLRKEIRDIGATKNLLKENNVFNAAGRRWYTPMSFTKSDADRDNNSAIKELKMEVANYMRNNEPIPEELSDKLVQFMNIFDEKNNNNEFRLCHNLIDTLHQYNRAQGYRNKSLQD